MRELKYNLLLEPLIGVRLVDNTKQFFSLPEVLTLLGTGDDIAAFTGLQLHQSHAWYAFLVQLAAMVLHRTGETEAGLSEDRWSKYLRALTNNRDEPWCLLVPELTQPAFMQPPVSDASLNRFKNRMECPDILDLLVTTKNHDVKTARIKASRPEHWVHALISLQTMQGFSGRGNYGIARMNSGFGNRPCVTYVRSYTWGERFRRDVGILLSERDQIAAAGYGYSAENGTALLWLEPWDGTQSMSVAECDPFFIEICRRVRLVEEDEEVVAIMAPTEVARVGTGESKGDTGDPWTPIRKEDGAALTVAASGFNYKLVQQLLFGGDYHLGAAARLHADDPDVVTLVATAMARGQGKTEGLHERILSIPARIRMRLGHVGERNQLAELSKRRVELAALARRHVLAPALRVLLQAAPQTINPKDDRTQRWLRAWDAAVDGVFFERLWEDAEIEDTEADRRWERVILDLAWEQLNEAIVSVPLPAVRRYRAIAVAERVFYGTRRKHFPEFSRESEEVEPSERD